MFGVGGCDVVGALDDFWVAVGHGEGELGGVEHVGVIEVVAEYECVFSVDSECFLEFLDCESFVYSVGHDVDPVGARDDDLVCVA